MAGALNPVGVLVTGTAVATTIGTVIVKPEAIGLHTVVAALITIVMGWVAEGSYRSGDIHNRRIYYWVYSGVLNLLDFPLGI
ncbi:MAG: hypothetical protein NTX46_00925 [Chloroflexi bacterium]|nr:hypothetical protein [Chloroflexota bacterium]